MSEYERLVDTTRMRVEGATRMQDAGPVLEDAVAVEARDLALLISDNPGDLQARHLLGWLHWYRYQAQPEAEKMQELRSSVVMFLPCFIQGMDNLPEPLSPILAEQATDRATELLDLARNDSSEEIISFTPDLWRRIVNATPGEDPSRAGRLSNLGLALRIRFEHNGNAADLDAAVEAGRQAVQSVPDDYPYRLAMLLNLHSSLQVRFDNTGTLADLDAVLDAARQTDQLFTVDHPERASRLADLGLMLVTRSERTNMVSDLDAALEAAEQAVHVASNEHPDRAAILSNVGVVRLSRFQRTGTVAELDAAISCSRDAVEATLADDHGLGGRLANLTNALRHRFLRTGELADLDEALVAGERALEMTPPDHPDHAAVLSNLGITRLARFERSGLPDDLDAAVEAGQQALQAVPADDPNRSSYLSSMANALNARFKVTGTIADLDSAVLALREAAQAAVAAQRNPVGYLSNLAVTLRTRFDHTGTLADVDAAITVSQHVVNATPVDHPNRARYLSNLGAALEARAGRTGTLADLDAAVEAGRQAMQTIPAGDPERAAILANLGNALYARFKRAGAMADLDDAVEAGLQVLQGFPDDHRDRSMYLSNLASALQTRFERTGALADLDTAIACSSQAVQAVTSRDADRGGHLSNLGLALRTRFNRTGSLADLDAAVTYSSEAVQATPSDHSRRAGRVNNLGIALRTRFEQTGELADLDAAITASQEAAQAIPMDDPRRASIMANAGGVLHTRFDRTGELADLDAAITASREAAQAALADDPKRAEILTSLGSALLARFKRTAAVADRDAAVDRLEEAANVFSAAPSARIAASRAGATVAASTDRARAARLLEKAVLLLPEVAPRSLVRSDQQHAIEQFAGLPADAAALALSDPTCPEAERPLRALQLLEIARGILLSQVLSTRSDLSELRDRHPGVAARFTELRELLDQPSPGAGREIPGGAGGAVDLLQDAIQGRRQAAAEFTELLAEIRRLKGFESFALPMPPEQLTAHAGRGAIVVLNISKYRSDAILLTSQGITSCPLHDLDQSNVISQINGFHEAVHTIAVAESIQERLNGQETLQKTLIWLWESAAEPVLRALGYLTAPPPGEPWPRLWWAPGGLLSLLPIHAAGHHTDSPDQGRRTVMDRVISSHTPTIGALAYARAARTNQAPVPGGKSLIVAMPTTPGLPDEGRLTYVPVEADLLSRRLPNPLLLTETPITDESIGQIPTKATVLEHLPNCGIAHFSCHGIAHPADPSQSRLLLHDHQQDPLTVAALASITLNQAQLAYLSACGTARATRPRLLDESIHLASAFQLAGFPNVIGTLWEIDDNLAVQIAVDFYAAITRSDGTVSAASSAHALHSVIRGLRDQLPGAPYFWASYIHAGA
jgi:hypothetical protein